MVKRIGVDGGAIDVLWGQRKGRQIGTERGRSGEENDGEEVGLSGGRWFSGYGWFGFFFVLASCGSGRGRWRERLRGWETEGCEREERACSGRGGSWPWRR